jgi:hypothetical protein
MDRLFQKFAVICSLALASCAPTSNAPSVTNEEALKEIRIQKQIAAREMMDQLARLYRVGAPIMEASAPLCGKKVWPHHGMMLESLSSVEEKHKDAMQNFYGVQNQLTAAYIVPGTPADGKIMSGDLIRTVNGKTVPSGSKGKKFFLEEIWKPGRDLTLPIVLGVERGRGKSLSEITIYPTPACASMLVLKEDDKVNAYADSEHITFTYGMMRLADNDDALAGVFGHELAHNARDHIEFKIINFAVAQLAGIIISSTTGMDLTGFISDIGSRAFSQDFETEADYIGLYMIARAGYNLERAVDFERRLAAIHPDAIHLAGSTHPSSAKRFISMTKTIAQIKDKRARGLPLLPEEKTGQDLLKSLDNIN